MGVDHGLVQAVTVAEPTPEELVHEEVQMIETALAKVSDPLFKQAMRAYWQAKRAERAGAKVIELFTFDEIYERDNWVCQLCGGKIDRTAPAGWKIGKSVDHWVPLSRGGDHTRRNCIAAHVGCNGRKMNMTPEEWIKANGPKIGPVYFRYLKELVGLDG